MEVAANLRSRAVGLRALAVRLDLAPLHALDRASGEITWVGPVAAAFGLALHSHRHALHEAAEELRWEAWLLERRAEAVTAEAALADVVAE